MRLTVISVLVVAAVTCLIVGCSDFPNTASPAQGNGDAELQNLLAKPFAATNAVPPSPLETVYFDDASLTFWPFTGGDFSGEGKDPINLIFVGKASPLDIRAALLALDGDRTPMGLPPIPPFNARWDDDVTGDIQASFSEPGGWSGGCIQLTCGEYGPIRFHLRLFEMGDWTVANAHFEMQIPGTANHQVLSWELAEQLVIGDFIRSGLLDTDIPMIPTQQINPSPWRTIPAIIYNELPVELRALINGPLGNVTEDVPILSDGHAVILNLAGSAPRVVETRTKDFVLNYGQVVPKPFCASGPADYVYVQGPVHMVQTTSLSDAGIYHAAFRAEGQLTVTPVDPYTGEPIGDPLTADVYEHHDSHFTSTMQWVSSILSQNLQPDTAVGAGRLFVRFQVRSDGQNGYRATVRCADNPWEDIYAGNRPAAMNEPTIGPGGYGAVR